MASFCRVSRVINILFFGPVVERVGQREVQLEFQSGMCLQDVTVALQARYPKAFEIVCFTAVNEVQTLDMGLALADNDEITYMAKFSGG
ncbi:MAG: MoaD/ThiS family protein [Gallionella sp.]